MGRHLPSPRTALALLTGLNLLNYLDRFIPGAVLPFGQPRPPPVGHAGRLAADGLHPELRAHLARVRLARGSTRALRARGHRRDRLERGDRLLRAGPVVRDAGAGTRADRRRRGELHRRHAVAAVRFLSARPTRARARHLLCRHPGRDGGRLRDRRTGRQALRLAQRLFRRRRARPAAGADPARAARSHPRHARSRRRGQQGRGHAARRHPHLSRTPELLLQHGGADHFHVHDRRPRVLDADLLRARPPHRRRQRDPDIRRPAAHSRLHRNADRRPRRRSPGPHPPRRPLPALRRRPHRVGPVHAAGYRAPLTCYLLAVDVRHAAVAVRQHGPAERRDGQCPPRRAARPRCRGQHLLHPRVRRRVLAARRRRRIRPHRPADAGAGHRPPARRGRAGAARGSPGAAPRPRRPPP